jgi:hypothetical protein
VADFLVNDVVPAERETVCQGVVTDACVPVTPRGTKPFKDPSEAVSAVETEIYYLPEYFYWDLLTSTTAGCTYGGIFNFHTNNAGTRYLFDFDHCEFVANFRMTADGSYHPEMDRFVLDIKATGR